MKNVITFTEMFENFQTKMITEEIEKTKKVSNGLGPAIGSMKWLMVDGKTALAFKLIGAVKAEKKALLKKDKEGKIKATKEKQKIVGEIFKSAAKGREKYKKLDPKKKKDIDEKSLKLRKTFEEMKIQ